MARSRPPFCNSRTPATPDFFFYDFSIGARTLLPHSVHDPS
jgi:hypothetical protein